MNKTRVVIMGAAGRDFHNFNLCYRDNPRYEVVAFTATSYSSPVTVGVISCFLPMLHFHYLCPLP